MGLLGTLMVLAGSIICAIGMIILIVKAFKIHIVWGVSSLIIPGASLVFCIKYWTETKNFFLITNLAFLMVFVGLYLSFSNVLPSSDLSSNSSLTERAEPIEPKIVFQDLPLKEGSCIGWQNSLARGRHSKMAIVEECLWNMAKKNRSNAVSEAKVLQTWDISSKHGSSLATLINTLVKFNTDDELEKYLTTLGLLNGKGAYEGIDDKPWLTADSYFWRYGHTYLFDAETGVFPNSHDYLLSEISELSIDINAAKFSEIAPKDHGSYKEPYTLLATFNEKKYEVKAENYGDWYDISSVLFLLNKISIESDLQDRFISLPTSDQMAIVMVIKASSLKQLVSDGLVILSNDNQSMLLGKTFENKVIKNSYGQPQFKDY